MPYIGSRVTMELSKEKKEELKKKMGEIIAKIPGKSEEWLMISFDDNKTIYFRGKEMDTEREYKSKVTQLICDLYEKELHIPGDSIYITFSEVKDWGFNGKMF